MSFISSSYDEFPGIEIPAVSEEEHKLVQTLYDTVKGDKMSNVRLIDANALEKTAIPCEIHNGALTELCVPLYQIRNAPTLPNPCGNPCNFTRPTGEWVYDGTYYDEDNPISGDIYHCSICKRSITTTLTRPTDLYPFCHCGAEMNEGDRE